MRGSIESCDVANNFYRVAANNALQLTPFAATEVYAREASFTVLDDFRYPGFLSLRAQAPGRTTLFVRHRGEKKIFKNVQIA